MNQSPREFKTAACLLAFQAILAIVLALLGLMHNGSTAVSLLFGAGLSFFANLWMALVVFVPSSSVWGSEKALNRLYIGEAGKFLFVMAGFALAFQAVPAFREAGNALLVLVAFAVSQALIAFWPLLARSRWARKSK